MTQQQFPTSGPSRRSFLGAALAMAARAAEPRVSVPAYNTLTDAEEVALGRKTAAALERELPILDVAPLEGYINGLVGELGRQSRRSNIRYTARIANTTDVNAVSLPGGYIFVFRGLLEMVRSESELMSVLAHEVGHIAGRHSVNQMMLDFRARQVYEIVRENLELRNTVIEQVIEKLGGPVVLLARLRYGREQEFEADMLGLYNQIRVGSDPAGAVSFFRRISLSHPGKGDWVADALSTHPDPAERAQRLQAEINGLRMPAGLRANTMSFEAMKLGLQLLPAPVRPRPRTR
jgi:predicted Zn-dependent protease